MDSRLIRRVRRLAALTLFSTLLAAPPSAGAGEDPVCVGPSLVSSLSSLRGSNALAVEHTRTQVRVVDRASRTPLFIATCGSLIRHGDAARTQRPEPSESAHTTVRRTPRGQRVYSHTVTSRGARVTVVAEGFLMARSLHVTTFDNDDVHVSDGSGTLIHSVTTRHDGTLVEREGKEYGCGCERITYPDGRTESRPLP